LIFYKEEEEEEQATVSTAADQKTWWWYAPIMAPAPTHWTRFLQCSTCLYSKQQRSDEVIQFLTLPHTHTYATTCFFFYTRTFLYASTHVSWGGNPVLFICYSKRKG
jgi:hypothetical protein